MEATEKRTLPPFHSIDFRGIGRVVVAAGEEPAAEVTAEQSLLARIRTEVRDGVLIVSIRWWLGLPFRVWDLQNLKVRLAVKARMTGAGLTSTVTCPVTLAPVFVAISV